MNIQIREIEAGDNQSIAAIIRNTLTEFGANRPGTAYYDKSTDHLFELFRQPGSCYYVVEMEGELVGGGGVYPTEGLPEDTCELVKMYLLPPARGRGLGKIMIEKCIQKAAELGYKKIYLETMPELHLALKIYAHFGFEYLKGPMGNSGHTGCSLWMIRECGSR